MNLPKGLKAVRFSFADQHGVLRGKTLRRRPPRRRWSAVSR